MKLFVLCIQRHIADIVTPEVLKCQWHNGCCGCIRYSHLKNRRTLRTLRQCWQLQYSVVIFVKCCARFNWYEGKSWRIKVIQWRVGSHCAWKVQFLAKLMSHSSFIHILLLRSQAVFKKKKWSWSIILWKLTFIVKILKKFWLKIKTGLLSLILVKLLFL